MSFEKCYNFYRNNKEIPCTLDYSGIHFHIKTHDYDLVEERFEMNVNVFCYENKIFPLYISKVYYSSFKCITNN